MKKNLPKISLLALTAGFCGCAERESGFGAPRHFSASESPVLWGLDAKERFRIEPMDRTSRRQSSAPPRLAFEMPSGWSELAAESNRIANFRIDGDEQTECYLSLLRGDGGGLEANVNRWRAQIGLSSWDETTIAALPRDLLFQRQAVLMDCEGTWKGMDGSQSRDGWRLLGLLLVNPQASAFFKMTGPSATLAREREKFLALARSFRFESSDEPETAAADKAPPTSPASDQILPMGNAQGLSWNAPGSWKQTADRPMRAVSFVPREGLDCYLAVLDGEGGGALANLNRWQEQMGRGPLSAEEFAALERIRVSGVDAILIEIDGAGEQTSKKMLGLVARVGGRSLFVKMTGPAEDVESEKQNFRAFAESIRENP